MQHTHKHKLKYIELFEGYIPYSEIFNGKLNITFPKSETSVPPVLNQLTTEVTGYINIEDTQLTQLTGFGNLEKVGSSLWIYSNEQLTQVIGFNNLKSVGDMLSISKNKQLTQISGFPQLQSVGGRLAIRDNLQLTQISGFNNLNEIIGELIVLANPQLTQVTGFEKIESVGSLFTMKNQNLVTLSIPSTIIRAVNYEKKYIDYEYKHEFKSPEEFVNHPDVIQDCIDKFNPELHSDVVVKQIVENVELWGSDGTKEKIYSHITQNGKPEHIEHLPEMYIYLYDPKHKNTGAKSVAKVATGVTYGLF